MHTNAYLLHPKLREAPSGFSLVWQQPCETTTTLKLAKSEWSVTSDCLRHKQNGDKEKGTAIPSVIHQVTNPLRTSVPPGGRFQSESFDIDGTESISVSVAVSNPSAAIKRTIFFGPSRNGGFLQARVDTFARGTKHLLTSLPTHGPRMFIVVDNTGPVSIECEGFLYAVRQVP